MRPAYHISNITASIIFFSLLLLVGVSIYTTGYLSTRNSEHHEIKQGSATKSIDSLLLIQIQIQNYDSINSTDSLMGIYTHLPPIQPDSLTSSNTINIKEIVQEIKYENLEQLQKREQGLIHHIDSLDNNIDELNAQLNDFEVSFDSISPLYSLKYRELVEAEVDSVRDQWFLSSTNHINRVKKNLIVIQLLVYFTKFLYVLAFLLFPLRWILIHLWKKNNSQKPN